MNRDRPFRTAPLALLLLAAAAPVTAQLSTTTATPILIQPRQPIPVARPARALAHTGPVSSSVTATGLLQDASDGASVQTGVPIPGDFQKLSDGSFLVAGRKSGSNGDGVVEHWVRDIFQNLVLASSYTLGDSDFTGVTWDENADLLYLLDGTKKKIWRAPWSGFGALPSTWTTWATTSDVGKLNTARDRYLDLVWPAGLDPATDPGYVYLGPYPDPRIVGRAITGQPGGITHSEWDWLDGDLAPDFLIDATSVSEGGLSVVVEAPSPVAAGPIPLDIVHVETGLVRGIGTLGTGEESVTISLSAPVVIGDGYVARRSGSPTVSSWALRAMRRYGFPETFADGSALRRMYTPPDSFIGNPILTLLVGVEIDPANPPATPEQDLFGSMRVGVRSFGDPVVSLGGGQFLLSPTTQIVPAVGKIGLSGHGLVGATIAIPFDPGLIGDVWFVQFELDDPGGGQVRSEVVGFEIQPF